MPVPKQNSLSKPAFISPRIMTGRRKIRCARKWHTGQLTPLWWSVAVLLTAPGCQWAATGQNSTGARLYEQGQYSAAMQQFQEVIAIDPDNADGYYNLAATKHRLGLQRKDEAMLIQAEVALQPMPRPRSESRRVPSRPGRPADRHRTPRSRLRLDQELGPPRIPTRPSHESRWLACTKNPTTRKRP